MPRVELWTVWGAVDYDCPVSNQQVLPVGCITVGIKSILVTRCSHVDLNASVDASGPFNSRWSVPVRHSRRKVVPAHSRPICSVVLQCEHTVADGVLTGRAVATIGPACSEHSVYGCIVEIVFERGDPVRKGGVSSPDIFESVRRLIRSEHVNGSQGSPVRFWIRGSNLGTIEEHRQKVSSHVQSEAVPDIELWIISGNGDDHRVVPY